MPLCSPPIHQEHYTLLTNPSRTFMPLCSPPIHQSTYTLLTTNPSRTFMPLCSPPIHQEHYTLLTNPSKHLHTAHHQSIKNIYAIVCAHPLFVTPIVNGAT
jgi:hypothetical protein